MKVFDSSIPIYLQLKEEIEKSILSGALPENSIVPSIRTLAQQYKINPQTVSNAFSELTDEGIIFKKRGIGFYVSSDAKRLLLKTRGKQFRDEEVRELVKKAITLDLNKQELMDLIDQEFNKQASDLEQK